MKKVFALLLVAALMLGLFAGCGQEEDGVTRIAIVQQLDHASMDEIRTAIEEKLSAIAAEQGMELEYKSFSGQNDATLLNQIGDKLRGDGYDAVIPIGTLAAQCMVNAADGSIPVIFAAVSDPEAAGLTGLPNVTGVSDALNTPFILEMMLAVDPDIRTVGLLYSNSEPNSQNPIAQAKAYLEARGIICLEKTGNTAGEILDAAGALAGRVDAVFTPTDNVVMASEAAVAEILNAAGAPHYAGADSFVSSGAFATCGVNYSDLGAKAAQMAVEVLKTGQVPAFVVMDGGIITVNTESAAVLKLDYAVFSTMAGTVIEVTTGA